MMLTIKQIAEIITRDVFFESVIKKDGYLKFRQARLDQVESILREYLEKFDEQQLELD